MGVDRGLLLTWRREPAYGQNFYYRRLAKSPLRIAEE